MTSVVQANGATSKHNEYSEMMKFVCSYASQEIDSEESEYAIGNTMRKLIEAFATFNYKKSIEDISCDEEILKLTGNESRQNHFFHSMYRLVLNSGSHYQNQTQGFPEMNLYELIDKKEKLRTAKELLVFLKLINPLHVKSHLGASDYEKIVKWENELF